MPLFLRLSIAGCLYLSLLSTLGQDPSFQPLPIAEQWRKEKRIIDLHQHVAAKEQAIHRAVKIMDMAGIGLGVNLSGGTVTSSGGSKSEFESVQSLGEKLYPGRFVYYMNLDYLRWDDPDFSAQAVKQVEEGKRLGAAGLKEYKRLGLYLKDKQGRLLSIDDPRLDAMWKRCGELGLPVSVHVGDPKAFWLPYDSKNERWTELKDHPSWWFGDPNKFPQREALLEALNRVIARHPKTTFVCVHFANNPEDLAWVGQSLDRYPNMLADLAARVPEIGRQDPKKVHDFFVKYQDRILFATDFMVYDKLTLGSGGSGVPPTDADALEFFRKHWRWMETRDKNFAHMTPIQGDWTISGIGLPAPVLRKIYFDNARKLLARSLPAPEIQVGRTAEPITLDGRLNEAAWADAGTIHLEYTSDTADARPELTTRVRALWSDEFLYLAFESPYTTLTVYPDAKKGQERFGLWEKDVVEAFIAPDPSKVTKYWEFEAAPNGELLDLGLDLPEKDFRWNSGFKTDVTIDESRKVWISEWQIPMKAISPTLPKPGDRWRANFFRADHANRAFLAWNPAMTGTFHTPDRFGWVRFK